MQTECSCCRKEISVFLTGLRKNSRHCFACMRHGVIYTIHGGHDVLKCNIHIGKISSERYGMVTGTEYPFCPDCKKNRN